jgi:methylmalonyl-CoA/ethylmalonyl-CoA epimerase
MIGKVNHIAIAVPDLDASIDTYKNIFGATVSEAIEQTEHGVTVVFVDLPNTKIELITPLGMASPIKGFLERNPNGGIHHICYEVNNIEESRIKLLEAGAKLVGTGELKIGAHGKPVLFLHPKDFNGTLIELEQS